MKTLKDMDATPGQGYTSDGVEIVAGMTVWFYNTCEGKIECHTIGEVGKKMSMCVEEEQNELHVGIRNKSCYSSETALNHSLYRELQVSLGLLEEGIVRISHRFQKIERDEIFVKTITYLFIVPISVGITCYLVSWLLGIGVLWPGTIIGTLSSFFTCFIFWRLHVR